MPANRNALIRYKTIDKCLRNRRRKWTLDDLVEAVSDALYEYEGMDKGISRRTVQGDIQMMRSDKLGYCAPISVTDKKYYSYEDPNYSIINIPISEQDLGKMNEAIEVLKQFKGFTHFNALNEVVNKLEDYAHAASNKIEPVIDFEKNEQLKGLQHLDAVYAAITAQKPVKLGYRSFKAKASDTFVFHVWWLKEFKNRWFAVGVKNAKANATIMTLALDRIEAIEMLNNEKYIENSRTTVEDYYKHVIGVTVSEYERASKVVLFVNNQHAPYVETKPLHKSQEVLERTDSGIQISLHVQLNYELEREILGFGDGMIVLAPERLRKSICRRLQVAYNSYCS